jgi:hypothetical protein
LQELVTSCCDAHGHCKRGFDLDVRELLVVFLEQCVDFGNPFCETGVAEFGVVGNFVLEFFVDEDEDAVAEVSEVVFEFIVVGIDE